MRYVASLTEVLERIYAPVPDEAAWLDGIRSAAGSAFDGHDGAQAYVFDIRRAGRLQVG